MKNFIYLPQDVINRIYCYTYFLTLDMKMLKTNDNNIRKYKTI